jgi:dihydropyrimidinase
MPQPLSLVIQNGTVVTASGAFQADVGLRGDTIAEIGLSLDGAETLDARGLLVMPGDVDPHVHLQYPQGPQRVVSSDD